MRATLCKGIEIGRASVAIPRLAPARVNHAKNSCAQEMERKQRNGTAIKILRVAALCVKLDVRTGSYKPQLCEDPALCAIVRKIRRTNGGATRIGGTDPAGRGAGSRRYRELDF